MTGVPELRSCVKVEVAILGHERRRRLLGTRTSLIIFFFFHGPLRPQKPYSLLRTAEEWDRE